MHDDTDPANTGPDHNTPAHSDRRAHAFPVIGIGASAGGIGALKKFFPNVTADSGLVYVVVLHLSPQHESSLAAILQSHATIPVTQVTGTVRVKPNHVYVIPPDKYLMVDDGELRLAEPERNRVRHSSIDVFFRTLAEGYGRDAIAIVLSGTGADGTLGLGRIKEEGGIVIAQDPLEAEYDGMPCSAIETGLVDLVLPAAEMPAKLRAIHAGSRRMQGAHAAAEMPPRAPNAEALRDILNLLRLRTGHDFSQYKRPTLIRRIARRLQVHELDDTSAYLAFVREHPEELSALLRDLLITVTNFFRDRDAFEALEREVIPRLFKNKGPNDQVRVWVVGCATGEEAYSIAILLIEHAARLAEPPTLQVFATDIDERAIAEARDCRYRDAIKLDVSPERLRQFFIREGDRYRVKKEVREVILFAPHNVLRDPPFSRLDLVTCRNLLIYLNREMQEHILDVFHFALRNEGTLFLGASESAEGTPNLFIPLDKKQRIYTRRTIPGRIGATPALPLSRHWQLRMPPPLALGEDKGISFGQLHHEVVEQLAPPSALVSEDYEILHLSEHATRYVRFVGGEPTRNLLKVVHPDLRLELRAALFAAKAQADGRASESRPVRAVIDGSPCLINLIVRAVGEAPRAARGYFLVLFDETTETPSSSADPVHQAAAGKGLEPVVRQLEEELQRTRDQLRLTVEQHETSTEELKASNEELQAINEELRSTTEELETSKEELQSVNEELTTVNQEYREKIEEVGRTNSDLQNLMASTDIATIFLSRGMHIKRYTPRTEELFNITSADIGRPLVHFTHKLEYGQLETDAKEVLQTLRVVEREIHTVDGCWFLARLLPYRTIEDRIDGVVITFVDITARKQVEEEIQRHSARLEEQARILDLASVFVVDAGDRVVAWHAGTGKLYGYSEAEALGRVAHELLKTELPCTRDEITGHLSKWGEWDGELVQTTRDGRRLVVSSHWVMYRGRQDGPLRIIQANNDITESRRAEAARQQAEKQLRFALDSAKVGDWNLDLASGAATCSPEAFHCFGSDEPIPAWSYAKFLGYVHPEDQPIVERTYRETVAQQTDCHLQCRVLWTDRSEHWIEIHGTVVSSTAGTPTHLTGIVQDITERKHTEQTLRDADRRKNEFLATLGHELRNPLAPIRTAVAALRKTGLSPPDTEKALAIIERQIRQMTRLLDDLLDLSRITRGTIRLNETVQDIAHIIQSAVEATRPPIESRQHQLTIALPEEPVYIKGDDSRLVQVVSNLLDNAAKYTKTGGKIALNCAAEPDQITIRVRDNGIGIPAELLPQVFDLFYQEKQKLDLPQSGLGIGLSLVKRLVELHGGTVEAHSEGREQGSEFVVRLPRSKSSPELAAGPG